MGARDERGIVGVTGEMGAGDEMGLRGVRGKSMRELMTWENGV